MKHNKGKGRTVAEVLFVGVFLSVYAFLILVADPEWLIWAGPILLGAFPSGVPNVAPAFDSLEALQSASFLVLPGLLALIFLVRIPGKARKPGISTAAKPAAEKRQAAAHDAAEHRKAA